MSIELKVNATGEIPAASAALVLKRISDAYFGLRVIDLIRRERPGLLNQNLDMTYDIEHSVWVPNRNIAISELQMKSVVLKSPGFWEFLGKLNPLEVIRQFLNDRHERKKDNDYRSLIEKERMEIENNILRIKMIHDSARVARECGMKESEVAALIRDNAILPLMRLEPLQEMNIISDAEIPKKNKELETHDW